MLVIAGMNNLITNFDAWRTSDMRTFAREFEPSKASSAEQLFDRECFTVQFGNYSPDQLNIGFTVRLARYWVASWSRVSGTAVRTFTTHSFVR